MTTSSDPEPAGATPVSALGSMRMRPMWRWCIALIAVAMALLMFVSYEIVRVINATYFKLPTPLGILDHLGILLVIYLLSVAISGRWRLFGAREAR